MRTTIDKAGRVVIPAGIRELASIRPGSSLEVSYDETGIHLVRAVPGPRLVRQGGRLVARPTVSLAEQPSIDIAALVDQERDRWP